jgi:CBS domain-containing protein
MTKKAIRDVMTANPVRMPSSAVLTDAARTMRDADVGTVIVVDGNKVCGLATDRDIVVRAVAAGKDPKTTKVGEVCSREVFGVSPDETTDRAVNLMREKTIRRLPVVENGSVVGIVSLGDLAIALDRSSVLADISAGAANR